MRSLREIFEDYAHYGSDAGHADKGSTHSYIEEYAKLLEPFRFRHCIFMEIGLAMGESLKMWHEYFTNANIVGVDISIVFDWNKFDKEISDGRLMLIEADATKDDFLNSDVNHEFFEKVKFDIVIDDASHMEADQIKTFNLLKNKMKPGGLYIIEDILSLDTNRKRFESLHDNCEIIDLRKVKGRFDDVLIIYRF